MPRLPLRGLTVPRRAPALLLPVMLSAVLALAGCDSSEERAETLLPVGDGSFWPPATPTARWSSSATSSSMTASTRRRARPMPTRCWPSGNMGEAYGQYLRLIEQYPDTPEVRRTLAEMAIGRGDWDEAERHGRAAHRA